MIKKIGILLNIVGIMLCLYSIIYPYFLTRDISNTPKAIEQINKPDGPTAIFLTAKINDRYLTIFFGFAALFAFNIYILSSKKFTAKRHR